MKNLKRKRYLAPGKLDFRLVLHAGSAWTAVDFKGGRASGYGEYTAYFETADGALQHLIECSPEFLSGKIIAGRISKENEPY